MSRRTFYPEIQPYRAGYLEVSPEHSIYFEESGNPRGKPAVFLHGGPGGVAARKRIAAAQKKRWAEFPLDGRVSRNQHHAA